MVCILLGAVTGCGGTDRDDDTSGTASQQANASQAARAGSPSTDVERAQSATPEECVQRSAAVLEDRSDDISADCADCICRQSPYAVTLCNEEAETCWGLLSCVRSNCSDKEGADESNCAVTLCGQFIEGAGVAMAVGVLLGSDTCYAACAAEASRGAQ